MILTPSAFTYELLQNLKFKELQKLSAQFHVNKRWAKKQELIENLLALKDKDEATIPDKPEEEKEWRDGGTVFGDSKLNNESNVDRRLTFSVSLKSNIEQTDPRLTFEVPQNGKNLLKEEINSRATYEIPPTKIDLSVEPLLDSRATFEIPPKKLVEDVDSRATFEIPPKKLVEDVDSRATFKIPQNGRKLLEENVIKINSNSDDQTSNGGISKNNSDINLKKINTIVLKNDLGRTKLDYNLNSKEEESGKAKPQVKMLTIPYAKVTRRTKLNEAAIIEKSPIRMSKKSINIKKSTKIPVNKSDLLKSPTFSSVKKSVNKQIIIQSLTKSLPGKIVQSKVPVRLQFTEEKSKLTDKVGSTNKENLKKNQRRRISKTADEVLKKQSNLVKVNFRTPPPSLTKSSKTVSLKKIPLKKDGNEKLNSCAAQTPDNKLLNKPITITKMPDFSKIHKRQFEQMDSLHDYLKKKEERIRKLFGTPQPGQQLQVGAKSAPVFRFQSLAVEKRDKDSKTPLKNKDKNLKSAQKETFKSKLPPSKLRTDIKDKNRSHIHGVRTNKRFELQMKLRNL